MTFSLTPCLCCGKEIKLLWPQAQTGKPEDPTNLDSATDFKIIGSYGSKHDTCVYTATICDTCLDSAVINGKAIFIRSYLDN